MRSPRTSNTARGFSLIEVLVVMALVALVGGIGMAVSMRSLTQSGAQEERDLLVSLLIGARAQALANVNESAHGVYIEADKYTLFDGTSWGSASNKREIDRDDSVGIAPLNTDIVFNQLSGEVIEGEGAYDVTQGDSIQTVTLNKAGQIDW